MRPTKYKPEYCELVIDTMAEGKSLAAVSAELRIARSTLYEWARDNPDFAEAIAIGKDLALAYWEEIGLKASTGEISGNASIYNFSMKNRFRQDYQDSSAMTLSGGEDPLKVEEKRVIEFIMPEGHEEGA